MRPKSALPLVCVMVCLLEAGAISCGHKPSAKTIPSAGIQGKTRSDVAGSEGSAASVVSNAKVESEKRASVSSRPLRLLDARALSSVFQDFFDLNATIDAHPPFAGSLFSEEDAAALDVVAEMNRADAFREPTLDGTYLLALARVATPACKRWADSEVATPQALAAGGVFHPTSENVNVFMTRAFGPPQGTRFHEGVDEYTSLLTKGATKERLFAFCFSVALDRRTFTR